ncbi:MAG: hypothetical protein IPP72_06545 [Chitinophagaceae bacterium]|nr:hypothetical protein [Chitinophagaceae bacterium]
MKILIITTISPKVLQNIQRHLIFWDYNEWQPVTMNDYKEIIGGIAAERD